MFVTIDPDNHVFLRKHSDPATLLNVAWVESHEVPLMLIPVNDGKQFSSFSEEGLRTLYFNSTGHVFPEKTKYGALVQVMVDVLNRMPVDDIKPIEAQAQADSIDAQDEKAYHFVCGSFFPGKQDYLFREAGDFSNLLARAQNPELMEIKVRLKLIAAPKKKRAKKKAAKKRVVKSSGQELDAIETAEQDDDK